MDIHIHTHIRNYIDTCVSYIPNHTYIYIYKYPNIVSTSVSVASSAKHPSMQSLRGDMGTAR